MIGNNYLQALFDYPDEDTSINQLLELLKTKDSEFLISLSEDLKLDLCKIPKRGLSPFYFFWNAIQGRLCRYSTRAGIN